MNPIEAAAQQILHLMPETPDCDWDGNKSNPFCERCQEEALEYMKVGLAAFFRAAFGCPQCGGTGKRACTASAQHLSGGDPEHPSHHPCPAEHVKIPVLGQTIWADPTKCIWWCREHYAVSDAVSTVRMKPVPYCEVNHGAGCGWQPRWDAINS